MKMDSRLESGISNKVSIIAKFEGARLKMDGALDFTTSELKILELT